MDKNYTGWADIIMLERWSLLKAYNIRREAWTVNCGSSQSLQALSTVAALHRPPLSSVAGSCARTPRAASTQVTEARVGKKWLCAPNIGHLWSDGWLLLQIAEVSTKGQQPWQQTPPVCLRFHPGDLRAIYLLSPFILNFSPFGSQRWKSRTLEGNSP